MRFILKDYQFDASKRIVKQLRLATNQFASDTSMYWSVILSAPTGAGKTVIASSVIETLFDGGTGVAEDPLATVLWVTDDPALNEQTKRNMLSASTTLGPGRLTTIDAGFDQKAFEPRQVYFLNIQKLARSNPLSRNNSDGRTYSLWETIKNTIDSNGAHFYVVIDEAHRGMKSESDRETIVSRIINGQSGINPPAPIVWGISATPERFNVALSRWAIKRLNMPVDVPIDEVRNSGLLKDLIILDNPAAGQTEGDTTLTRAGVLQTLKFEEDWLAYAQAQSEPPVIPVFVVQVPNKPSDAELSEILGAIFGPWPGLKDKNVVNTFADHVAISVGGHTVGYMAPQDIQDDDEVRVVLCKDAISTGWDCPRAEVLVSLRRAEDATYIAQLIGRMVRTPLARRIPSDQTLNVVHCYLPRFDKKQVGIIVKRFSEGTGDDPPIDVITNPVRLWHNEAVPAEVFDLMTLVPTYMVPGRVYRTQIARLSTLATLLSGDHIVEDALAHVRIQMNGVLGTERAKLETDGSFAKGLKRIRSLKVERSYALLAAETMDDLPETAEYDVERDDNNIEDLYKVAKRKLPEGVASNYWNSLVEAQGDDDYDPTEAKAETAVLALHNQVIEAVEKASEAQVQAWLKAHQSSIAKLPDARKDAYEPVRRETRNPELTELELPDTKVIENNDQRWAKHLLADEKGEYPAPFKGWEAKVLAHELADADLVGWYRNPIGTKAALRVPYRGTQFEKPMYPDFVFFHQTDEGLKASIVDPHGFHLSDASAKLMGMAGYASDHGDVFDRIEAVVEIDGKLVALDLKSETVRDAVGRLNDGGVKELFEQLAGDFS